MQRAVKVGNTHFVVIVCWNCILQTILLPFAIKARSCHHLHNDVITFSLFIYLMYLLFCCINMDTKIFTQPFVCDLKNKCNMYQQPKHYVSQIKKLAKYRN